MSEALLSAAKQIKQKASAQKGTLDSRDTMLLDSDARNTDSRCIC